MITEIIVMVGVGIALMVMGFLIWKKGKINLLHDYHYRNVKKSDYPAYTKIMGQGQVILGASLIVTTLINNIFKTGLGWIVFAVCTVIFLIVFIKAQKKYNGGVFG